VIWLASALSLYFLALTLINALTIGRPRKSENIITSAVAILIPMRNEESSVSECLASALGQENLSRMKVLVLDDLSTDKTRDLLLHEIDKDNKNILEIIAGGALPNGWLGKNYACHQLAQQKVGGHESIKSEILDDIELARSLLRAGSSGSVVDGSRLAYCRMYSNAADVKNGYTKSLWKAFGNPLGSVLVALLLAISGILPLVAGILGSPLGWFAYFVIVLSRLVVAVKTRSYWQSALLHPISIAAFLILLALSWIGKSRGTLQWRGRKV